MDAAPFRRGLEAATCACYALDRETYANVMHRTAPAGITVAQSAPTACGAANSENDGRILKHGEPPRMATLSAPTVASVPHSPEQNRLLAALSPAERERLYPRLRKVKMPLGKALYEPGDALRYVFFPVDCIVSLLYVLENGASAEISVVGNEGLIGVALFMGGETTPSRAIVQSAGHAYRLDGQRLKDEFHRSGGLQLLLLRYTQSLITQMAQTAVCNRHHSVDQQLCRWLLLSLDRLASNELVMTQELIANMLGVRREGVTDAAGKLQRLGVIRYSRGHITVLDRPQLEQLCCECYAVVKRESDRIEGMAAVRGA
jgi:CRP-like cAMP-binding protein